MITINETDQTVDIQFGKNGQASIFTESFDLGPNGVKSASLLLQQLEGAANIDIGTTDIKSEDVKPLPKIIMNFHDEKSVDIIIDQLNRIKKKLQNPYGDMDYALAC